MDKARSQETVPPVCGGCAWGKTPTPITSPVFVQYNKDNIQEPEHLKDKDPTK